MIDAGGSGEMILVDDRAGSRELIRLPPVDDYGVLTRLDSGDVAFAGNGPDGPVMIGVEVKSVFDLISSADTGRLQARQVPAMLQDYDVCWLLYFGEYRPSRDQVLQMRKDGERRWFNFKIGKRPVPYGYLESLLLTLTTAGIHVKRCTTVEEAAAWLGVLYRWWSKPWSKHRGMHTFDNSRSVSLLPNMDPELEVRAKVAAQLPGIGFERAVAVARHFESVQAMVDATVADWTEIYGIGKVIAKAARSALR